MQGAALAEKLPWHFHQNPADAVELMAQAAAKSEIDLTDTPGLILHLINHPLRFRCSEIMADLEFVQRKAIALRVSGRPL